MVPFLYRGSIVKSHSCPLTRSGVFRTSFTSHCCNCCYCFCFGWSFGVRAPAQTDQPIRTPRVVALATGGGLGQAAAPAVRAERSTWRGARRAGRLTAGQRVLPVRPRKCPIARAGPANQRTRSCSKFEVFYFLSARRSPSNLQRNRPRELANC